MMEIDIVGEDAVTQAIIKRLLNDFRKDISIGKVLPARGGQIKKLAPLYNKLASPVFLLTDLDDCNCPPMLIKLWFEDEALSPDLLFRIAQTEAESWLMSDREGFAKWIGVDVKLIPEKKMIDKKKEIYELHFSLKPSLYMMLKIASESSKKHLKADLTPLKGAKKGPAYNAALVPFIENHWSIENAINNSYSLNKAIQRLKEFKV